MRDRSDRQDGRSGRPWDPAGRQSKARMRVGKKGGAPSYGHCPGAFPAVSASLPPDSEPGAAIPSRVRRAMLETFSFSGNLRRFMLTCDEPN